MAQTQVCAIGAASLATAGVQDGLLAVPGGRLIKQVLHDQLVSGLRAFDTSLLTLMKGDEVVEAGEEGADSLLLLS